jgi:Uncharacterized protein conserved in bacteria (DUF2184)
MHKRGQSFAWDSSRKLEPSEIIQAALQVARSYSMDAAGSSGFAFLSSMLEYPNVELVRPLASVTHPRDIPIKTGGGFVELTSNYAVDYGTVGGNQYGLQGTQNTDIAQVQANVTKGLWKVINWQASMSISWLDLQRLAASKTSGIPAPYSLQELLDEGVKLIWNKALDRVTYLGWNGMLGLCNNTAIVSQQAALGASASRLWANKTPIEWQTDINTALLYTQENSGYDLEGLADTILVDFEHWSLLNAPMTIAGCNSALEFILKNNVAERQGVPLTILPLPDPWISAQGVGGTNQLIAYRKSEKSLRLQIPAPLQKVMTVPSVALGGSYETVFAGAIGQVQILRPTTALYLYGI